MQFLIAYESLIQEEISILKGEEILALFREKDDDCVIQVNGQILLINRVLIESRCKQKPPFTGLEYLQPVVAQQIAMIRQKTLRRLATVQSLDPPMMASSPIQAPAHQTAEKPKSKKTHLRKKSIEAVASSIVKKEFILGDDKKDKDKDSKSDKDKTELPKPVDKEGLSSSRGAEGESSPDKEKDDTSKSKHAAKKAKKEQQKQINTAVASWYNAPSTRSSNSFFGPNGFNINRLALASRHKERVAQRERDKKERDFAKDNQGGTTEKEKSDPSQKNILKSIVPTELFPTPRKKAKGKRTPSLLSKSARKPVGVMSDESVSYSCNPLNVSDEHVGLSPLGVDPEQDFASPQISPKEVAVPDSPAPSTDYPPPTVNYPPPTVSYPPPAVNYPPPTVNYPPPTVSYPPPSVKFVEASDSVVRAPDSPPQT
jgi:hypothetical protein